jgi:hypothetical protein
MQPKYTKWHEYVKKSYESSNRSDVGKKYRTHEERCSYYDRFLKPLKSLAIGTMLLTAGMGGVKARPEAPGSALQKKGYDNTTGLTHALNQTEFNNLSYPTALEFNPYTYKVTPELLDHLRNVGVPDPEQLIRNVQQGIHNGETSSDLQEQDKNKERKQHSEAPQEAEKSQQWSQAASLKANPEVLRQMLIYITVIQTIQIIIHAVQTIIKEVSGRRRKMGFVAYRSCTTQQRADYQIALRGEAAVVVFGC